MLGMKLKDSHLPGLIILVQALINIPFYGIPAILLTTVLPPSASERFPWLLQLLIMAYFSLAVAYLYHVGFSFDPSRARLFGGAYFLLGLILPSLVICSSAISHDYETPLLFLFMALWVILSLIGLVAVLRGTDKIGRGPSIVLMLLVALSAVISASTLEW
jgi:hypothetical protein